MITVDMTNPPKIPLRMLDDGQHFELGEDITVNIGSPTCPLNVEIPAGYITDLASIPPEVGIFGFEKLGRHSYAAIVHDWLYDRQAGYELANAALYSMLKQLGVSNFTAAIFAFCVQSGGKSRYKKAGKELAEIMKGCVSFAVLLGGLLSVSMLGGCGSMPNNLSLSVVPITFDTFIPNSKGEQQQEAEYAKEPPCNNNANAKDTDKCSRDNPSHVSYWTSRPDKHGIACKGAASYFCDSSMPPHCHGFGSHRYCHAHPGGDKSHDHLHPDDSVRTASLSN